MKLFAVVVLAACVVGSLAFAVSYHYRNHEPAPLTAEEQLSITQGQKAIQQARQVAFSSKEAIEAQRADAALKATKEYKALVDAQKAVQNLKETKDLEKANVAAGQTKEVADFNKANDELTAVVDGIFAKRGLDKKDYIICDGPAESQPACKDVGANKMALRKLVK